MFTTVADRTSLPSPHPFPPFLPPSIGRPRTRRTLLVLVVPCRRSRLPFPARSVAGRKWLAARVVLGSACCVREGCQVIPRPCTTLGRSRLFYCSLAPLFPCTRCLSGASGHPVLAPPCVGCACLLAMPRPLLIALLSPFPPTPSSISPSPAHSTHAAGAGCAVPPVPTTVSRSLRGRL